MGGAVDGIDLGELRAFIAVVEHGSLLGAAAALNVSRTTLRRRLDALEERVGHPLLHRSTNGVSPTVAGTGFVAGARRLVDDATALFATATTGADPNQGIVRTAVPIGMAPGVELAILGQTMAAFPDLCLWSRQHGDPVSLLPDEADLAVSLTGPGARDGVVGSVVFRVQVGLLASPRWLAEHGAPGSVADVAHLPLALWQRGPALDPWVPVRDGDPVRVEPRFSSNNPNMVRGFAAAGLGLALAPDGPDGLTHEEVVRVLADEVAIEVPVWLVVPRANTATPRVRAALELIRELAASLSP